MKFVIEHLSKSFEKKEVLRDIDFTFDEGKIYGLLGRNGAGKTTLFNCLNRDLKADSGNFYIEDENGVRREVSAEDIGYVLSTPTVPEFLTGREFLKFFMDINEKSIKNPKSIDEYFDYMSIEPEDRDKLLKDYSHGMKNKMQMLINIIAQPNILLLDEPLTSLDVVVAEEMKQLLRSLKQDRITIFSTHIMDLALDLCDEIVLLNHGELEVVEKTDLDSREFKDKIIAALLGSCMVYYVGAFFAPLFPRHMLYEYKSDIKKLKEEYREAYFFFPDAIPEEATDVTWVVCPSMMQGSGYEFLGFKASEEYINSIVAKYKEEAHVRNRSEESYDKKVFDNYLGEFSETAVDYELYNNNDWNHERMWGILVSKENGYIGFYCQ